MLAATRKGVAGSAANGDSASATGAGTANVAAGTGVGASVGRGCTLVAATVWSVVSGVARASAADDCAAADWAAGGAGLVCACPPAADGAPAGAVSRSAAAGAGACAGALGGALAAIVGAGAGAAAGARAGAAALGAVAATAPSPDLAWKAVVGRLGPARLSRYSVPATRNTKTAARDAAPALAQLYQRCKRMTFAGSATDRGPIEKSRGRSTSGSARSNPLRVRSPARRALQLAQVARCSRAACDSAGESLSSTTSDRTSSVR
jgi:hypothetical protein